MTKENNSKEMSKLNDGKRIRSETPLSLIQYHLTEFHILTLGNDGNR